MSPRELVHEDMDRWRPYALNVNYQLMAHELILTHGSWFANKLDWNFESHSVILVYDKSAAYPFLFMKSITVHEFASKGVSSQLTQHWPIADWYDMKIPPVPRFKWLSRFGSVTSLSHSKTD
ncbi:hypothetical protein VNO77_04429 [Canavalia gladiata]|uniref:Uncharacterized protein n=1 Tax=Canavalia gladiata TaxID=3824 RepID=A0AAN9N254_CANGL